MVRQAKYIKFSEVVEIEPQKSFTKNFSNDNKYIEGAPFKNIQIINIETNTNLKYFENSNDFYDFVPQNYIMAKENREIERLRIENLSSTETAKIYLILDNDDTQLSLLKEIKEKLK